jgi:hypothetical protein
MMCSYYRSRFGLQACCGISIHLLLVLLFLL